jgi:hypothetical protein
MATGGKNDSEVTNLHNNKMNKYISFVLSTVPYAHTTY